MRRLHPFLKKSTAAICASTLAYCSGICLAGPIVEITQKKSQKSLSVEVLRLTETTLKFKAKSGKKFEVKRATLTDESIQRAEEALDAELQKGMEIYKEINAVVGCELFAVPDGLWSEQVADVATRLGWPKEYDSEQSSSYRYYASKRYLFLGAHPYSATLYGQDRKPTHLSLVFANKGDYGSNVGRGEDHFKKVHPDKELPQSLGQAIKLDAELINEALTKALGEPVKQYYGEKEDRRKVLRWNLESHAFLLSEVENEYVSLLIVPTSNADNEGKTKVVPDADLRRVVSKNVVRESNGDTVIKNIPMVDQGPKGYCAPATFERAMRYMSIPADMYLLATPATDPGGGTNTSLLAESCKRIVRSKARRIKDLDLEKDLKMRRIKPYIDKGVPILWCMRSLKSYNKIANERTKERAGVQDFRQWKVAIAKEASEVVGFLESNESNHHICMIIGYNEETQELAVSDSWGASYALRWVHIDIAKAVTSRGGFVIDL